jgi:hypothetical protein
MLHCTRSRQVPCDRFVRMRVIWASLIAGFACSSPESRNTDSARPQQDTTAIAREIYIDSVTGTNPLVTFGRARTFENTVQVRARDASGREIVEVFTTSAGEMGHHNPFSAQLWISRDPGPRVTVDAFEYSANDGSVRSLISQELPYGVDRVPMTLMFPTDSNECTATRAFTRSVPKAVAISRLLVEALVAGPDSVEQGAGARSPFPKGSRVQSVVLRDGTLTVDFNERLQNVGGSCAAQAIRESVTQTLQRLPTVLRVVITAGGSEKLALQP